jgi:ubiquinone biosynthesis accessory factor UbiK
MQARFDKLIFTGFVRDNAMNNPKFVDDISSKLNEIIANSPAKDFEKNARALLSQGFAKLDLVTREEFDIQSELLSRTRQKLEGLEKQVSALEAQKK